MPRPKGFKLTEDHKRKVGLANSIALLGNIPWNKNKSSAYSAETKKKMGEKNIGNKYSLGRKHSQEAKDKNRLAHLGKKASEETKRKMRETWAKKRMNKKIDKQSLRSSDEYKQWRLKVFERDNFTCQKCGQRGVELHADHIRQFAYFPELRFEIFNGRTLCVRCHKKTETFLKRRRIKIVKELDDLLSESDFISLNVPLVGNEGFFTKEMFLKMKPTSFLINTSRSGVIEPGALLWALQNKIIAAAAVDFTDDPELVEYAKTHSNLILTPHIGGHTHEDRAATDSFIKEKAEKALRNLNR